jgi:hypothetical protein
MCRVGGREYRSETIVPYDKSTWSKVMAKESSNMYQDRSRYERG